MVVTRGIDPRKPPGNPLVKLTWRHIGDWKAIWLEMFGQMIQEISAEVDPWVSLRSAGLAPHIKFNESSAPRANSKIDWQRRETPARLPSATQAQCDRRFYVWPFFEVRAAPTRPSISNKSIGFEPLRFLDSLEVEVLLCPAPLHPLQDVFSHRSDPGLVFASSNLGCCKP